MRRVATVSIILAVALVALVTTILVRRADANTAPVNSSAAAVSVTCTFGATGADVQVQITDDSTPCATQEQALASDGLSWHPVSELAATGSSGTADSETMGIACVLNGTSNASEMTVEDAGGMNYGLSICSAQEQGGNWTNTGSQFGG